MKNGFTFIEMMIVVVILGIFAAVAIPAMTGGDAKYREKAIRQEQQKTKTLCIGGFTFLNDGKTQILNSGGGGIPCNTFN